MANFCWVYFYLLLVLCFGLLFVNTLSREDSDSDSDTTAVYIVTLKQAPAAHSFEEELRKQNKSHKRFNHGAPSSGRINRLNKPRHDFVYPH